MVDDTSTESGIRLVVVDIRSSEDVTVLWIRVVLTVENVDIGLVVEEGVGVGTRIMVVLEGVELIELGDSIEVVMVDEDTTELGLVVEEALEVTASKEVVDKVLEDTMTVVVVPADTPFDVEVNVDPV